MEEAKIFECVKLLEVEETQPATGGELPHHGIGMLLAQSSCFAAS